MLSQEVKDKIFAELDLEKLPKEKSAEIMIKFEENIQRKVVLDIFDLLKEEDRAKLIEITEPGSDKNISSFLSGKVPMSVVRTLIDSATRFAVEEFKRSRP